MMNQSYLPPEWQDEERMRVLMGPMPALKNHVAFNSRITFWTAALYNWCKTKNSLTFSLYDGQMAFRRGTQVPTCLPEIFLHLIKNHDLITLEEIQNPPNKQESWVAWSKKFVMTPSQWVWSAFRDAIGWNGLNNTVFINRKVLEERGEELFCTYWRLPQNDLSFNLEDVISVEELYKCTSASSPLSLTDLNLILHHLAIEGKIALTVHQGRSLVKFAKPGQTELPIITTTELAEHELRATEEKLLERIKALQSESFELRSQAKKSLSSGLKIEAMSLLRRKRRCEKSLKDAFVALENISLCLQQIQDSKLNTEILNTFQLGANALKSSIAAAGGTDRAYKEMESLQEVLDDCREISDSLAYGIQSSDSRDDADIEHELEELMGKHEFNYPINPSTPPGHEVSGLPNVPRSDPLQKFRIEATEMS